MLKNKPTLEKAVMDGSLKEFVGKKKGFSVVRLLSYFKYHKLLTAFCVALATAVNFAAIAQPYILKTVIDNYLTKGIYELKTLLLFGLVYMTAVSISTLGGYQQTILLTRLGQSIMHRIRVNMFSHIQKLGMGFFDRNSSGKILTRINSDVESLSELYSSTLVVIVKDTLMIIVILIAMFSMNRSLALWCLWSIPAVALYTLLYRYAARNNFKKVKAQLSKLNAFLAENIIGMKIVQIFAREDEKLDEFHELGRVYCRLGVREILLNSLSNPLILAISNIMVAILIGRYALGVKEGLVEVGVIYAFATYLKQLFQPVAQIADQFTSIQSSLISADRVFDLMDSKEYLEDFEKRCAYILIAWRH
jgi:ATP-binding cassette subfamily B protein